MTNLDKILREFEEKIEDEHSDFYYDCEGHYAEGNFDMNAIKFFLTQVYSAGEKIGYEKGLRENMIRVDEFFAEGIAKGTDEASVMIREEIKKQGFLEGAEQERKKLGEVCEKMKIEGKDLNRNGIGYNEALSDLQSSLNQGK